MKLEPKNPLESPRFGDVATFNRLPYLASSESIRKHRVDVGILGVPFDGGATYRPGARFGPRAVRAASALNRNYHPTHDVAVFDHLGVADIGDVAVNPLNLQKTLTATQARVSQVLTAGAKTICVGGDHSIVLAELRAYRKKYKKMGFIQFDAHTDTGDTAWGEKYHHGTPIRRAIEERLLDPKLIFQIGIRGPLTHPSQEDYVKKMGINVLSMDDFENPAKKAAFFKKIKTVLKNTPSFLSFDVDGVDPAFCPGTGTPVVGGMSSAQAFQCVRSLKGLNIVGADLVEIAPAYDVSEITALFGAAMIFEFLSLMAMKR